MMGRLLISPVLALALVLAPAQAQALDGLVAVIVGLTGLMQGWQEGQRDQQRVEQGLPPVGA
jgi:hypothetical protein